MNRFWVSLVLCGLLLSCQKPATREVLAQSDPSDDNSEKPRQVSNAFLTAKTLFHPLAAPHTLRVIPIEREHKRFLMEIVALQGLVNRRVPDGNMVYLEGYGFPDAQWLKYYASNLNLETIRTAPQELLDWVRENTDIRYYIVVNPIQASGDIDQNHACTINIAHTLAGIVGNAIPALPDNVPILQAHGFSLLPDAYCDSLGSGGRRLRRPDAFDLRNQWKSGHSNAPWNSREDVYKWALDVLAPLTNHQSITVNSGGEALNDVGTPEQYEAWINDYPIANKEFIFHLNPQPSPEKAWERTDYDRKFYVRLLKLSGPLTTVRGWLADELSNLGLISKMASYQSGSRDMANATVHQALSPLFEKPFSQRKVEPDEVNLDPDKIYLTFSFTDGDQFAVVYRGWKSDPHWSGRESLWDDPARGRIPINWPINGLMYSFGRGIMRYYFDNATSKDYFIACAPVGYAWLTHENFGPLLEKYDAFADDYLQKAGLPAAFYMTGYGSFPLIADSSVQINTRGFKHADAIIEGYTGGFYQGIYWPEDRPLMPYIRNTLTPGMSVYGHKGPARPESPETVARQITDLARQIPFRPLFMHLNWVNWAFTPSDMLACYQLLQKSFPGKYEVAGLPEFVALAQKAKLTGRYPLEFKPHPAGEMGLEAPYIWQQNHTQTSGREEREHPWRGTRGDGFFSYKFNVAPSRRASLSVDLAGDNFRMDISSNNRTWTEGVIKGSSAAPVTRTADLSSHLNDRGSVYIRFTGDVKVYHVKVDYGP